MSASAEHCGRQDDGHLSAPGKRTVTVSTFYEPRLPKPKGTHRFVCHSTYLIRVSSPYNKYALHIQPVGCGILLAVILRQTIQYCALRKGKYVHDTWLIN